MGGETEEHESGLTVDTLKLLVEANVQAVNRRIDDLIRMLDERYATQTKNVDTALASASTAMQLARTEDQRNVATALSNQEKAVTKAETAAEKRFESVNEFRAQLTDQAATFVSRLEADARRAESDARIAALADKFGSETQRNSQRISEVETRLTSRLDLLQGADAGATADEAGRRQRDMVRISILTGLAFAVSVAVAVITLVAK